MQLPCQFTTKFQPSSDSLTSDFVSARVLTIGNDSNVDDEDNEVLEKAKTPALVPVQGGTLEVIQANSMDTSHSHKKSKGSAGSSTVSIVVLTILYLSPQRKGATVNKRVSLQSSCQFTSKFQPSSDSLTSDSVSAGVSTMGNDSNNDDYDNEVLEEAKTPALVPVQRRTNAEI